MDKRIDPDTSDCASNAALAEDYRSQSLAFVQHELRLNDGPECRTVYAPTAACSLFAEVAPSILEVPGQVDIALLTEDLDFMMRANGMEQNLRLGGKFPAMKEYLDFRRGTGSVDAICSVNQLVDCLPPPIVRSLPGHR